MSNEISNILGNFFFFTFLDIILLLFNGTLLFRRFFIQLFSGREGGMKWSKMKRKIISSSRSSPHLSLSTEDPKEVRGGDSERETRLPGAERGLNPSPSN